MPAMQEVNGIKRIPLEVGMYEQAARTGKSFSGWLEEYQIEKGMEPTPYFGLTNFEVALKQASLAKQGKEVPKTAFEMQLEAHDVKAFGMYTDKVDKFFVGSGTSVLFPEFISNRVYAGSLQGSIVPRLVAIMSGIDELSFAKLYLEDQEKDREWKKVAGKTEFPTTTIKHGKQNISLGKFGRTLDYGYEILMAARINIFALAIERMGKQIGLQESDALINVLFNGDGALSTSNGLLADNTQSVETSGSITKKDVIKLASALPQPYQLNKAVAKKDRAIDIRDALSDMSNPAAQWGMTSLTLPEVIEWDRDVISDPDKVIGVDSANAIEYVTNDAFHLQETDKVITNQSVKTVISKRSAFSVVDQNAIGALDAS